MKVSALHHQEDLAISLYSSQTGTAVTSPPWMPSSPYSWSIMQLHALFSISHITLLLHSLHFLKLPTSIQSQNWTSVHLPKDSNQTLHKHDLNHHPSRHASRLSLPCLSELLSHWLSLKEDRRPASAKSFSYHWICVIDKTTIMSTIARCGRNKASWGMLL